MFKKARLKLTFWYLLIIMLVSIFFSLVVYTLINQDYNRFERVQRVRQEREQQGFMPSFEEFRRQRAMQGLDTPYIIQEARTRLQIILLLVNLCILGIAGMAGYFLAGRTLRPIKEMVDEQSRFMTDASHELRTPLTSLKSEIEVNLRDDKLNLKDAKKLLTSNLEEVNKLQLLSDNLIKLTQYQKNNGNIIFDGVSLIGVLEDAQEKVAKIAKHKNITIKNNVKDYILQANGQSLSEALVIFLDNAIKYSPNDTVITITSKQLDHSIMINIQDQGMGIEKDDLPHLFDRFYRADKSRTKADIPGYGLGLSIAKQIIDKHNGSIKVDSEIGQGTTFSIFFPLKH